MSFCHFQQKVRTQNPLRLTLIYRHPSSDYPAGALRRAFAPLYRHRRRSLPYQPPPHCKTKHSATAFCPHDCALFLGGPREIPQNYRDRYPVPVVWCVCVHVFFNLTC